MNNEQDAETASQPVSNKQIQFYTHIYCIMYIIRIVRT
jgi:hypothetical protein